MTKIAEIGSYIAYTDGSCNNLSPYGEGGARAVEPVECLYSITPTSTLAAFNFVNSNGVSILQVAQKLYESKIGDKDTSQSEDEFRDEIYWFTILSHLTEKGHRIK